MTPKYKVPLFGYVGIDYGRKTLTERILETMSFDPPEQPEWPDYSPPDEQPTEEQHGDE